MTSSYLDLPRRTEAEARLDILSKSKHVMCPRCDKLIPPGARLGEDIPHCWNNACPMEDGELFNENLPRGRAGDSARAIRRGMRGE